MLCSLTKGSYFSTDLDEHHHPHLTLDDIPYKAFGELCEIGINLSLHVKLTDSDLLDLESAWPWLRIGRGGITLNGLVHILRRCPSLFRESLATDTRTFTHIPDGLDVSFLRHDSHLL